MVGNGASAKAQSGLEAVAVCHSIRFNDHNSINFGRCYLTPMIYSPRADADRRSAKSD